MWASWGQFTSAFWITVILISISRCLCPLFQTDEFIPIRVLGRSASILELCVRACVRARGWQLGFSKVSIPQRCTSLWEEGPGMFHNNTLLRQHRRARRKPKRRTAWIFSKSWLVIFYYLHFISGRVKNCTHIELRYRCCAKPSAKRREGFRGSKKYQLEEHMSQFLTHFQNLCCS